MNRQREVQALLRRGHQIQSKLSKLCEVRTNSINRRYNSGEDLDSGRVHALSLMLKTPEEPLKRCLRQSFYHGQLLVCKYTRDRSVRQLLSSRRCVHFCRHVSAVPPPLLVLPLVFSLMHRSYCSKFSAGAQKAHGEAGHSLKYLAQFATAAVLSN